MSLRFQIEPHTLVYHKPATTSRGALSDRKLWLVKVFDPEYPADIGIGECGIIPKLSPEDRPDFEQTLLEVIEKLNKEQEIEPEIWEQNPALRFAVETAILDLETGSMKTFFETTYSRGESGIWINGLVWMASLEEMIEEAKAKVQAGFDCIKFKVGTQDFDSECRMIEQVRKLGDAGNLQIRLDANGAFLPQDTLYFLKELNRFGIHSIEQPIKPNQWEEMEEICAKSPIPIALDEELIGINPENNGAKLLQKIKPQFIILKPSLLGGLAQSDKWISLAENLGIGWWATSALESNIGLNAIAQWLSAKPISMPQGLGTGKLYQTNFDPETEIVEGKLWLKI